MATRAEMALLVQAQADAESATRWSPQEVLIALDVTFRREWDNILASAPYERINVVSAYLDGEGKIPVASLTSGAGDTRRMFNSIIQLSDGVNVYKETRVDMVPPSMADGNLSTDRLFYLTGDTLQVYPATTNTLMRVIVNWKPVSPLELASDSSVVDFPAEGVAMLYMGAAALLLSKGGTETNQAASLLNLASQLREDMLSSMRRRTNMPKFMRYPDSSSNWASR